MTPRDMGGFVIIGDAEIHSARDMKKNQLITIGSSEAYLMVYNKLYF